jgi:hypothetical protein
MPESTAVTAPVKPVSEPNYDVAISFLVADEKIASEIKGKRCSAVTFLMMS